MTVVIQLIVENYVLINNENMWYQQWDPNTNTYRRQIFKENTMFDFRPTKSDSKNSNN